MTTKKQFSISTSAFFTRIVPVTRLLLALLLLCGSTDVWGANYKAKVTRRVNPANSGTVLIENKDEDYTSAQTGKEASYTISISASPTENYDFDHWEIDNEGIIENSGVSSTKITISAKTKNGTTQYTLKAVFKEKPKSKFYFNANALVSSAGGGTAAVDKSSVTEETRESSASHTFSFSADANDGYEFIGWSETDGGTIVNTTNPYNKTVTNNIENSTVATTLYANFEKLKVYNFAANAIVKPDGYGTVTASVEKSSISTLESSASTTATFTVTSVNDGYYWIGWNETESGTATTEQTITATLNNSTDGSTVTKTMYAIFGKCADPTSISADNFEVAKGGTYTIPVTLAPSDAYRRLEFASDKGAIATVDANGKVTGVSAGQAIITIKAFMVGNTDFISTTITATVKEKVATPVISFTPTAGDMGETATASITCTTEGATIYYTTDGTTPTNESTPYNGTFTVNNLDVVKAIAIKDGYYIDSEIATAIYSTHQVPTPTISVSSAGVEFSCEEEGVTFYYTTDGSTPTTGSTQWDGSAFTPTSDECTIKVIAVKAGAQNSDVAERPYVVQSGIKGNTVILNDYEDHNWAYYKGREGVKVGTADDAPYYNDKYLYTLYSPDPRNVKITYRAYNTEANTITLDGTAMNISSINGYSIPKVSVADDEAQNTFVYYKTLEKYAIGFFNDANGNGLPDDADKNDVQYPYTVISNPFSVRPSTGSGDSKQYYGFGGWKVISGGQYIGYADNAVIPLDQIVHFTNFDSDEPNSTSAEVVLEATWTVATVKWGTSPQSFDGGTYETNFIVANGDINSATFSQGTPCTITAIDPDGQNNNSTTLTITRLTVSTEGTTLADNTVKVEWMKHGNGTFNANGRNMILGRGITSSTNSAQGNVYGNRADQNSVNTVKVESGYYSLITNLDAVGVSAEKILNCYTILGCDYDRAQANYYLPKAEAINSDLHPYNTKLRSSKISGANGGPDLHRGAGQLYIRSLIKSGVFGSSGSEYYFHAYTHNGQRYIEMEGGYIQGNIKGGSEDSYDQHLQRAMSIRMRNGRVDEQIGCGSTSNPCSGDRMAVVTGGRIGGWIAPGSNCSSGSTTSTSNKGATNGTSYVYFGGTAEINSRQFGTTPSLFYQSTGGVIYGSGLGYQTTDKTGEMTLGSNVVFADDAYCERGIYGGGAIGQTLTTANIFILGGHVGTGVGQINVAKGAAFDVPAGVYGGACNRGGENSFIYMDGGTVESGIYGGSNYSGTMSGNVIMQINGGQVGTKAASADVYGGGYGQSTAVSGNVDIKLGTIGTDNKTSGDAAIYGDVYGGSALGTVNTNTSNHTTIKVYDGDFYGNIYGGGLGQQTPSLVEAIVNGEVEVDVYGGRFHSEKTTETRTDDNKEISYYTSGQVFGCNNQAGTPKGKVTVNIFKTGEKVDGNDYAIGSVYGGGNDADYVPTYAPETGKVKQTTVNVVDCNSSIDYVYGGGNAADVPNTEVNIYGANTIGTVFGGGNGVRGAAYAANIIGTSESQKGTTHVNIYGGKIGEVFGGSNSNGDVTGSANVFLDEQKHDDNSDLCPYSVGGVYGAGNEAVMHGASNMEIGCLSSKLDAIYGGAKNANINNDIDLRITSGSFGQVFGGNNLGGTINGSIKVTIDETGCKPIIIDELYGGGNQAAYTTPEGKEQPTVNVVSCTHIGKVFGGGLGAAAVITGNPSVNIQQIAGKFDPDTHAAGTEATPNTKLGTIGTVFGGGNAANVVGNTNVNIGTIDENAHLTTPGTKAKVGANIIGNVYGGGNQADVTGATNVVVGVKK